MEVVLHPVDGETVPKVETVAHIEPAKKRGRPPGAKNKKPKQEPEEDKPPEDKPEDDGPVEEEPEESSDEPPKPTLPIPKRKKRVVVESESEEELPRIVRRKKPIQPKPVQPQDSPRTRTFKLRQDYHNQRVNGYTHMLNEMLSY
jgi:hypothetical protein